MENLIAWILMAAISLPISFLAARGCLRVMMRLMSEGDRLGGLSLKHREFRNSCWSGTLGRPQKGIHSAVAGRAVLYRWVHGTPDTCPIPPAHCGRISGHCRPSAARWSLNSCSPCPCLPRLPAEPERVAAGHRSPATAVEAVGGESVRIWEKDRARVAQDIVEGRPFDAFLSEPGRFDAMFGFRPRSGRWRAATEMRPSGL